MDHSLKTGFAQNENPGLPIGRLDAKSEIDV